MRLQDFLLKSIFKKYSQMWLILKRLLFGLYFVISSMVIIALIFNKFSHNSSLQCPNETKVTNNSNLLMPNLSECVSWCGLLKNQTCTILQADSVGHNFDYEDGNVSSIDSIFIILQ